MFDQFKKMTIWKVGNQWMAQPWAWSPLVLWYNAKHIKKPPTSINFLFDPALRADRPDPAAGGRDRLDGHRDRGEEPLRHDG